MTHKQLYAKEKELNQKAQDLERLIAGDTDEITRWENSSDLSARNITETGIAKKRRSLHQQELRNIQQELTALTPQLLAAREHEQLGAVKARLDEFKAYDTVRLDREREIQDETYKLQQERKLNREQERQFRAQNKELIAKLANRTAPVEPGTKHRFGPLVAGVENRGAA